MKSKITKLLAIGATTGVLLMAGTASADSYCSYGHDYSHGHGHFHHSHSHYGYGHGFIW